MGVGVGVAAQKEFVYGGPPQQPCVVEQTNAVLELQELQHTVLFESSVPLHAGTHTLLTQTAQPAGALQSAVVMHGVGVDDGQG